MRTQTPNPRPAATGWGRLCRPTAFKLTLLLTVACLVLRGWERGRSGSVLPILRTFEHALGDLRFRERATLGRARLPTHVVVIAADETSIDRVGFWPWPRRVYADLIDKLTASGVRAVVFDIGFLDTGAQLDLASDAALATAIDRSQKTVQAFVLLLANEAAALGNHQRAASALVFGKAALDRVRAPLETHLSPPLPEAEGALRSYPTGRAPIPAIAAAATWFGYFNAFPDEDGVLRRTPLLARLGDHLILPSIDLAGFGLACGALAPRLITPLAAGPDALGVEAVTVPCEGGVVTVPVEQNGQMLLDYQVGWAQMPIVSAVDVLQGEAPKAALAGKIALIAATAQGTYDLRSSPLDSNVPGGVMHAVAIEQLVTGRLLTRPGGLRVFEIGFLLALGLIFGWLFSTLSPLRTVGALVGGVLIVHCTTLGLFLAGFDVVSALPLLQLLLMATVAVVFRYFTEEKEKRFIENVLGRYVSASVRRAMLADPSKLRLGGEKRELTVLFSDIRGFTSLSEALQPEQLVTLLNGYLNPMTELVLANDGTLDKYMGDALMAFWGAPLTQPDHALRAVKTAEAMMHKLQDLQASWRADGLPELDIGIGISSGPMVVGNMGSESRFDYTVMGDAVNLGSRLEGTNKVYGTHVILSEETERLVHGQVTTRQLDSVRVKGKHRPVKIFELVAVGSPPAAIKAALDDYALGMGLYRQRQFDQALHAFTRAAVGLGKDKTCALYITRCEQLRLAPPGDDWDGISDLLTK